MKIAIVLDCMLIGGVQKVALQQAAALRLIGHDVGIFGFGGQDAEFSDVLNRLGLGGMCVSIGAAKPLGGMKHFSLSHLNVRLLERRLQDYDLIIGQNTIVALGLALSRKLRCKTIAIIYDSAKYVLGKAQSSSPRRWLGSLLGYCWDRAYATRLGAVAVSVIPHGIVFPESLPDPALRKYFLFATRWERGKNEQLIRYLCEACPDEKFVVVGKATEQIIKSRLEALNGLPNCNYLGSIAEVTLEIAYTGSLAWIGTMVEGFGVPALEAAANGSIPIIPAGSGVAELFDRESAILADPSQPESLAAAVRLVASLDEDEKAKMRTCARRVAKQASWEGNVRKVLSHAARVGLAPGNRPGGGR